MNLNKCQCSEPGLCPLYSKKMDKAGHNWCKTTTKEKRQSYKNKSSNINLEHEKVDIIHADLSKVNIACLGHCKEQFDTIEDQDYINKIYLDDLDLGVYNKFQTNAYSETRAYLSDIFDYSKYDYVGCTTASWNMKYVNKRNRIDRAGRWLDSKKLDDKKTIYCATVSTTESWVEGENSVMNWMGTPKKYQREIIKYHEGLGFKINNKFVGNHNQIICHKDLYRKISGYFQDTINDLANLIESFDLSKFNEFARERTLGYFCELSTMILLSNIDVNFIPVQANYKHDWFKETRIIKRNEGRYDDNR